MPRGSIKVDGHKIRDLRQQTEVLGLQELAALVGIQPQSLWQIEMGRQTTMPSTLKKIAKVLRVKPAELMQRNGSVNRS